MEQPLKKFHQEVKKNYKVNFYTNIFDGAFFSLGIGFVSITTILPLFIRQLTASKFVVSMIVAIFMFGSNIPQIFTARWAETFTYKKNMVLFLGFLQRLPWLVLALLTYFLTPNYTYLLLIAFFLCWSGYSLISGIVIPFWFDFVTKIIPVQKRGRFFGYRSSLSSILEVLGAFLAGIIIKQIVFPYSFTILFGLVFLAVMISWSFLLFVREPVYPLKKEKVGIREYFKKLPLIIENNKNFKQFLISIILIRFIVMANGLFTVAAIERMGLNAREASSLVGIFTILYISSQSLTTIFWGHISDRYGHKIVIVFLALFNSLGTLIAYFANSSYLFYLVFILTGIALGGQKVSFMTIIPEFCPAEDKPTYIGITNTISGITVTIVSLLGGLLADFLNYKTVFGFSTIMMVISLYILHYKVVDPRFDKKVR